MIVKLRYWLFALPLAFTLGFTPAACEHQPVAPAPAQSETAALAARMDAAAAAQVKATTKAYEAMPDVEKAMGDAEVAR